MTTSNIMALSTITENPDDQSLATLQQLPKSLPKSLPYIPPSHFFEAAIPIPNPTPSENAFLYHDIGEQVGMTWQTLHNIVIRHEPAIAAAWDKKSSKRRLAILSTAWGDKIPEHKRPDWWFYVSSYKDIQMGDIVPEDSLFGTSSKKRTALTYPYINESHLVQKKALPLLINSRGRAGPDDFYQFNLKQTNIGRYINALIIPDLDGFCIDISNEEDYGVIIPTESTFHAYYLTSGETLMAMQIHIRVMKFLIRCCQLILNQNDLQILTGPNNLILPEVKVVPKTQWLEVADLIWDEPLVMPTRFSSARIVDYLTVRASAAEDHIWDLRENPGYFAAKVMEWSEHQRERMCFPDGQDILETGTPKFWNIVIKEVIADAFESCIFWQILYRHYHHIHGREVRDARALSCVSGITPDCAADMHVFQYLLAYLTNARIGRLWAAHLVSPYNRELWRKSLGPETTMTKKPDLDRDIPVPNLDTLTAMMPTPNTESSIITLTRLLSDECWASFGYTNMVDDIGYALAVNPLENTRMSACSQRLFSDLGLSASIQKEIDKHQTISSDMLYLSNKPEAEIFEKGRKILDSYDSVGKRHRDYSRLAALGTPVKGRFDYPVNERRTLEVNRRMQESENNLHEFWKRADEEYKEKWKTDPIGDINCLVFDKNIISKTPDWVEPKPKPKKIKFVDRELLIKELCESELPKKKKRSKNSKNTPKIELDSTSPGVRERVLAGCESSRENANDPGDGSAETSDTDLNPSMENPADSKVVCDSERTENAQTESVPTQLLPKAESKKPKKLETKSETTTEAKADQSAVPSDKIKRNKKDNVVDVGAKISPNVRKGCEMKTKSTTKHVVSKLEAQKPAYKPQNKAHSGKPELSKEPETRSQKKLLASNSPSREQVKPKLLARETLVLTLPPINQSSVNTTGDTENQKIECIVEKFRPGCDAMMSGGLYDDTPLTPECFFRIPESEFKREVCPRRPALEALIKNKSPDWLWTQVGKKTDKGGYGGVLAVDAPKINEENYPPLTSKGSQAANSECGRRDQWACQRRKSLDVPIEDESQRGRPRVQVGNRPKEEVDTELVAREVLAEDEENESGKWWSRAMFTHRAPDLWVHASGPWARFSWHPWPTLGRPRGDSNPVEVEEDEEDVPNRQRTESISLPIAKASVFTPEGAGDSYDPLEASAEIYNQFEPYTRVPRQDGVHGIHDVHWQKGDSDWEDGPTWRHIEWKKAPEPAAFPPNAREIEIPTSPKSQLALEEGSSRSQSLSGDSQKEVDPPTAFSTNTTVSPQNPKLALAAADPAAQEAAILAYKQANQSLEKLAAAQIETGSDDSQTLYLDLSEEKPDYGAQLNGGEIPPTPHHRWKTPDWDKLSLNEKNAKIDAGPAAARATRDEVYVMGDARNAAMEAVETSAHVDAASTRWDIRAELKIHYLERLKIEELPENNNSQASLESEAVDQNVIQATGDSATSQSAANQLSEVNNNHGSGIKASRPRAWFQVGDVWIEHFVDTGMECRIEDDSIDSGAEYHDASQGIEELPTGDSTSQVSDVHVCDIIAEDQEASGCSSHVDSPQSGPMGSEDKSDDPIRGAADSAKSELQLVEDHKLRRIHVLIAIPWNLIGVRRGMKIPAVKWPVAPKPPIEEIELEDSEQDLTPEPSETSHELEQDPDSADELLEPGILTPQSEALGPEEVERDGSPEEASSEETEPQAQEQEEDAEDELLQSTILTPPSEATGPEEPEHNHGQEQSPIKELGTEEVETEEPQQDQSQIQPSSEDIQAQKPQQNPSEEIQVKEFQPDQNSDENESSEANPQTPIPEPRCEETDPKESTQDHISGQQSSKVKAESPYEEIDGVDEPINSQLRESPTKPRQSNRNLRGRRKWNKPRNGFMKVPPMPSSPMMRPGESEQEQMLQELLDNCDVKQSDRISSMIKNATAFGAAPRGTTQDEEWLKVLERDNADLMEMIKSRQQLREDKSKSNATASEGVTSNPATGNTNAAQGTGVDANDATFKFAIPQDPHGYLNAYSEKGPLTALVADESPKSPLTALVADESPTAKLQREKRRTLATRIGMNDEEYADMEKFAAKLDEIAPLKPARGEYINRKSLCSNDSQTSESDFGHDIYYVSKPSYKVFSAIFHDPLSKQPRASFLWSEFLTAMSEIEFTPIHEYGTLWHFALNVEGMGIQFHQPPFQGSRKDGMSVKVGPEESWVIGRRLARNYGYGKDFFLLKGKGGDMGQQAGGGGRPVHIS